MGVAKNSNETVQLIPALMHMNQQTDMNMFQITLWDLNYDGNYNKLRVLIVMRRKILSEIMTTYFPSILLLAITLGRCASSQDLSLVRRFSRARRGGGKRGTGKGGGWGGSNPHMVPARK